SSEPHPAGGAMLEKLSSSHVLFNLTIAWDHDHQLPVRLVDKVCQLQMALAFGGTPIAQREESRQAAVCLPVGGIDRYIRGTIGKDNAGANDQPKVRIVLPQILRCCIGPNDAGERIAVTDANT